MQQAAGSSTGTGACLVQQPLREVENDNQGRSSLGRTHSRRYFHLGHGSGYAQTSTWKIDPAHSSVNFEISHMAVSHVHGSLTNVNGIVELNDKDITKSSVEATIDTTTVSTGVVMRDNTLKSDNFFNVQKYPQITFRSSSLRRNKGTVQLLGNLTLNDVTRSVTLDLYGPSPPQTMSGKTISGFSATELQSSTQLSATM